MRVITPLLFLVALATPALAQPTSTEIARIRADPAANPARVTRLIGQVQALAKLNKLSSGQYDVLTNARFELFKTSRHVLNNRWAMRDNPALARAMLPMVSKEYVAAVNGNPNLDHYDRRSHYYDAARAIRHMARKTSDKKLDRAIALPLLKNLVASTPYVRGRRSRRFLTQFEVHELFLELFPGKVPVAKNKRFEDWIKLEEVGGKLGRWINGLAKAWTGWGRRANTKRILERIDALEAARTTPTTTTARNNNAGQAKQGLTGALGTAD